MNPVRGAYRRFTAQFYIVQKALFQIAQNWCRSEHGIINSFNIFHDERHAATSAILNVICILFENSSHISRLLLIIMWGLWSLHYQVSTSGRDSWEFPPETVTRFCRWRKWSFFLKSACSTTVMYFLRYHLD